jgi:flagellin
MPVSINTNSSATLASQNLSKSNALLQKSLQRLSSGSKIASASDDAGGLAVSLRLEASLRRNMSTQSNVANALSFLQTQDGALNSISSLLARMAELKTLSKDVTKTDADIDNYFTEFKALQQEFTKVVADTFNGISLFSNSASTSSLTVSLTEDGSSSGSMAISQTASGTTTLNAVMTSVTLLADFKTLAVSSITEAISEVAKARATNGAQSSRLQFALDALTANASNIEAANSRIIDVDVASETTRLARNNILVQAGTAMLAQANASSQIALKLLQ